jgi:Acyltransferase family
MTVRHAPTARELAAATPETRDRYVDLLRGVSILAVVCGHWLMADIWWRHGHAGGTNALTVIHNSWILTWILQVMPLFFFVGGFSNSTAWSSIRARGEGYASYLAGRVRRLMAPTAIFLSVWVVVANVLIRWLGHPFEEAANVVAQPLWFIGIYLVVVALAPPMLTLHKRYRVAVPVGLTAMIIGADALRHGLGVPVIGWANFPAMWLLAQQIGFFYADGSLTSVGRPALAGAAAVGLGGLVGLTASGLYPKSMVGVPGDKMSNMTPPSVAMLFHTIWLVALAMLLRSPARRWLERRKTWTAVVGVNGVIMTAFLWHLTALLLGVAIFYPMGFPQPGAGTTVWWLTRPVWIVLLGLILAGLVRVFVKHERAGIGHGTPATGAVGAAAGMAFLVGGVLSFALGGFTGGPEPAGIPILPLAQLGAVIGGVALLGARRTTTA